MLSIALDPAADRANCSSKLLCQLMCVTSREDTPAFCGLLIGSLAVWAIITLLSLGTKLAQLNEYHDLAVSARALKWRILLSNIVTNVVMALALTAVYRMAIHLVYTHELNS